jgi:hypothetical protein
MKYSFSSLKTVAAVLSLVVLASCGGGDDAEAGAPVEFNVFPETFGLKAADGVVVCPVVDNAVTIFINGGAAPYTISNPYPDLIRTSTIKVEDRGGSFVVSFLGGCTQSEGVSLLVKDSLNKQVAVTLVFEEGDPATP